MGESNVSLKKYNLSIVDSVIIVFLLSMVLLLGVLTTWFRRHVLGRANKLFQCWKFCFRFLMNSRELDEGRGKGF